jgi:non-ribosomal peptide synthetase component E (peptide arylation enzyme)
VVPVPDDLLGERAAALVVATAPVTIDSLREGLSAAGFPKFKWPERLYLVDDLPQNRVGKLNRDEAGSWAVEFAKRPAEPAADHQEAKN